MHRVPFTGGRQNRGRTQSAWLVRPPVCLRDLQLFAGHASSKCYMDAGNAGRLSRRSPGRRFSRQSDAVLRDCRSAGAGGPYFVSRTGDQIEFRFPKWRLGSAVVRSANLQRGEPLMTAIKLLLAGVLTFSLPPTPSQADQRADFLSGRTRECVRCDLAGENFKRRDLSNSDLTGANLKGANLHDAKLAGAHLGGAGLSRSNLNKADLRRADLTGANLREAMMYGANLDAATLSRVDLTDALMGTVRMVRTQLTRAVLRNADLRKARLADAILTDADLTDVVLDFAFVRGARFDGARLVEARLIGAELIGASLVGADL